jgi:threonine dehydratase
MISLSDIQQARKRIAEHLRPTLLEPAPGLGENVWLKLENTNRTHSFKIRGALNAILSLDEQARSRGIVAASSGNHAQGVAYAAQVTGVPAKIIMPAHTPKRKVDGVRHYGAIPILDCATYDDAEIKARRLEKEEGLTFVSGYNDPAIVAGAGTIGLEILDEVPDVERVIVPVSGGGLISGVAAAIKLQNKAVEMLGVSALNAPSMHNLFYDTELPEVWETLAEALSGGIEVGSITIELVQKHVDKILLVTENHIKEAMRWLVDEQGWIVEGGGAVGVAAMLRGLIKADGQKTVIVISGGNLDGETVRKVLGVGE